LLPSLSWLSFTCAVIATVKNLTITFALIGWSNMLVVSLISLEKSLRSTMILRGALLSTGPVHPRSVLTVACDNIATARHFWAVAYWKEQAQVQPLRRRDRITRPRLATLPLRHLDHHITGAAIRSAVVQASQWHSRITHRPPRSEMRCSSVSVVVDSDWRARLRRARVVSYSTRMAGGSPKNQYLQAVPPRRFLRAMTRFLGTPRDRGGFPTFSLSSVSSYVEFESLWGCGRGVVRLRR